MSQAFEVVRGRMEPLDRSLDTFGTAGMMDGTTTWLMRLTENATSSTLVDEELSRCVTLSLSGEYVLSGIIRFLPIDSSCDDLQTQDNPSYC